MRIKSSSSSEEETTKMRTRMIEIVIVSETGVVAEAVIAETTTRMTPGEVAEVAAAMRKGIDIWIETTVVEEEIETTTTMIDIILTATDGNPVGATTMTMTIAMAISVLIVEDAMNTTIPEINTDDRKVTMTTTRTTLWMKRKATKNPRVFSFGENEARRIQ